MHRLAPLEHHVVRGVHHVRDRAHAGRGEPGLHGQRRRRHRHAANHPGQIAWAALGVEHLHDRGRVGRLLVLVDRGVREADRSADHRRRLPSDAQHRHQVGPVRLDLDIEDDVVQSQQGCNVSPHGQVGGQNQDAAVIAGDAQLERRADHPLRLLPAHGPDREWSVEDRDARSRGCVRHAVAHLPVGHPGRHPGLAGTGAQASERQVVRTRVRALLQDLRHDHAR